MKWMVMPMRRYAEFGGRSRRREYWMFFLFTVLLGFLAAAIDTLAFDFSFEDSGPLSILTSVAVFIPSFAVGARRLHDVGRSGWWLLLLFVVIVGWILLIVFFVTDGDHGDNAYGSDPKLYQDIGEIFS